MDRLQRAKSTSWRSRSPGHHRTLTGRCERPTAVEKGSTTPVPIEGVADGVSQGEFPAYRRPVRYGTVRSKPWPEADRLTPNVYGGAAMDDMGGTGIIAIGMAVGSPTLDHDIFTISMQPQVVTTVSAPKDNDAEEQQAKDGLMRTKSKRWALFGRSKSYRVKHTDRSDDQPSPPLNATVTRTIAKNVSPRETLPASSLDDSPPTQRRHRERALTESAASRRQRPPPSSPPDEDFPDHTTDESCQSHAVDENFSDCVPDAQTVRASPETLCREPLLDVEIPDITLERYSIMFAGLLERRATTPLLARRKNTQEKLWELREDSDNGSLQADLSIPKPNTTVGRASPLISPLCLDDAQESISTRSNTSPVMLTSSCYVPADVDKHKNEQSPAPPAPPAPHIVRLASVRGRNPKLPVGIHKSDDGRPQLRSKFHVQSPKQQSPKQSPPASQSRFSLDDATDDSAGPEGYFPSPSRYNGGNPSAEMENTRVPQNQRSKTTNYTPTIVPRSPSIISQESLSEEEMCEAQTRVAQNAIQVSVVRQISICRDQRHAPEPLRMHPVNRGGHVETTISSSRLIDTKNSSLSILERHRKNERAVLSGL